MPPSPSSSTLPQPADLSRLFPSLPSLSRLLCVLALSFSALQTPAADFHLPDGFTVQPVTDRPLVRFPMFAAFDDQRRLYVAESSGLDLYEELQNLTRRCRISVLEDTNDNGIFDASHLFAEQLVFPMGLAWRNGKLYVADPPELITLEDTDGDHRADKRTVLLSGFGHTDNGSLHGLTFGPDGWLYLTMGQPDGFRITRSDRKIIEGKSGALLRCKPDGSELEVVCRGFENLVEVIFMPTGEIIGTDNWFFLPQDGVRDALVHLVPGGVYPLNAHAQFERDNFHSGELLPPLQVFPAVALSGLMRYEGRAFPEAMHGSLFSAQFNTRKIGRHTLARHGGTFQSLDEDFLTTSDPDFHPSDVLEDSDGSIIVVDTGSWYVQHCPTGRIRKAPAEGGLYRIRHEDVPAGATKKPKYWTDEIWASARSRRGSYPSNGRPVPMQLHIDAALPADSIALFLRAIARDELNTSPSITSFLSHPAAHVRLAAAEAAAAKRPAGAVPAITKALTSEADPFIVHALIYALHQTADARTLSQLLENPAPPVRRAALILLDQAPHRRLDPSAALDAMKSTHAPLRAAALAAFNRHPEWNTEALSLLKSALAEAAGDDAPSAQHAAILRVLLPTFLDSSELRDLVFKTASNERAPSELRQSLLEALLQSGSTDSKMTSALRSALDPSDPELMRVALRSLPTQHIEPLIPELTRLVHAREHPLALRLDALRAIVRHVPQLAPQSFGVTETALAATNPPSVRLAAAELHAASELTTSQFNVLISAAQQDRLISPTLVISAAQRAQSPDANPLLDYLLGSVESGWPIPALTLDWLDHTFRAHPKLESLRASASRALEDRLAKLAALEPLLAGGDPNAGHQLFLGKLACATCHRVGKTGGLVGPDLTRIGAIRSGRDLLESLVYPSATMAQGYDSYLVTLTDGEALTGIRVRQVDDAFVLRDSSGAEVRLRPTQIAKTERLQNSLMPEGLVANLEREEMRDLLAYLQSLK